MVSFLKDYICKDSLANSDRNMSNAFAGQENKRLHLRRINCGETRTFVI